MKPARVTSGPQTKIGSGVNSASSVNIYDHSHNCKKDLRLTTFWQWAKDSRETACQWPINLYILISAAYLTYPSSS